jgi:hypothetical protein
MFKEEREESRFEWSMLGDLAEGRPNLGPTMHVAVYRLMQFTLRDLLIRDYGVEKTELAVLRGRQEGGRGILQKTFSRKRKTWTVSSPISSEP